MDVPQSLDFRTEWHSSIPGPHEEMRMQSRGPGTPGGGKVGCYIGVHRSWVPQEHCHL